MVFEIPKGANPRSGQLFAQKTLKRTVAVLLLACSWLAGLIKYRTGVDMSGREGMVRPLVPVV